MNNAESIRQISPEGLLALGVSDLAYIKPLEVDSQLLFGVFAADGSQLAVLPTWEVADATIRRNDLEPVSVH